MELLDSIREAIKGRDWKDMQFCDAAGIDQSVWSRIKNGQRPMSLEVLKAVSRVLPEVRWEIIKFVIGE